MNELLPLVTLVQNFSPLPFPQKWVYVEPQVFNSHPWTNQPTNQPHTTPRCIYLAHIFCLQQQQERLHLISLVFTKTRATSCCCCCIHTNQIASQASIVVCFPLLQVLVQYLSFNPSIFRYSISNSKTS